MRRAIGREIGEREKGGGTGNLCRDKDGFTCAHAKHPQKRKNKKTFRTRTPTCISPRAPDARRLRRGGGEVIARLWRVRHPSLSLLPRALSAPLTLTVHSFRGAKEVGAPPFLWTTFSPMFFAFFYPLVCSSQSGEKVKNVLPSTFSRRCFWLSIIIGPSSVPLLFVSLVSDRPISAPALHPQARAVRELCECCCA